MNEQDFKQWLRDKTDATPIPEHLLPEHITEEINDTPHKTKWYKNPWMNIGAACLLVCIIGTSIWTVNHSGNKNNVSMSDANSNGFSDNLPESAEEALDGIPKANVSLSKSRIQTAESYRQLYYLLDSILYSDEYLDIAFSSDDAVAEGSIAEPTQNSVTNETSAPTESKSRADSSYYDTNTQVEQVAEADIVKTDGTYIYSCYRQSGYNTNAVAIAKADHGILDACSIISAESILSQLSCSDFYIKEMYVTNHRLILLCQAWTNSQESKSSRYGSGMDTYILTYNTSNAEKPVLLSTLMQEGNYCSSRFTNGYLYTFSRKWEDIPDEYEEYDEYIPHTEDTRLTCNDIYIPACPDSSCYQIMTSMALDNPDHFATSKAILSGNGTYYVSENNIYFAQTGWEQGAATTELLKFRYADGSITPEGSVTIDGYLLNQFSMDEYEGFLRVAATVTPSYDIEPIIYEKSAMAEADRIAPVSNTTNALYIIDSDMNLVGKIDDLAPGERIYSVRFMGDTGYFVTYRETDPLFSVDLSDPANPVIMDALKIPGFSNYLHFYSEDLLLGLGEEINPVTGEFMGLKLSMFDISDPYHISELDKTVLSNTHYSTALYNHKALMIDPERNIIGFYAYEYDDTTYESKEQYLIYSYVEGSGFQNIFTCNINEEETLSEYVKTYGDEDAYECIRGLYIGDYLYLVLGNHICSYSLDTYDKVDAVIVPTN